MSMMKFEKEFRKEHPETIGETDSAFDMHNYAEWLEKKCMKEFRESGYGDKPWNYDTLKEKQNKDVAIEYAFYLVSESFVHLGGVMHQNELAYKGTKKWNEAKYITKFTIEKMKFNPFTNELIENSGFWERVQEEINNL